jgi:hypothetical protein
MLTVLLACPFAFAGGACVPTLHACSDEHAAAAAVIPAIPTLRGAFDCPSCEIQLHLVLDAALTASLGGGVSAYASAVAGGVDALWAPPAGSGGLGLRVRLVGVTALPSDPWPSSTDPIALLQSARTYTNSALPIDGTSRDAVILLTAADLDGSTLGGAFVGALCQPNSVGVAQATGLGVNDLAASVAHQIGHLAGASHDGFGNACASTGFVMSPITVLGSPATAFSSCTVAEVQAYLSGTTPGGVPLTDLLAPAAACAADLNNDGVADFGDVSLFVSAFGSGDLLADLNADGVLDFGDVSAFVSAFAAGC